MPDPGPEPLLSVYENDPEMAEIVACFVSEMPERRSELAMAVDRGDVTHAARIAHQLKGAVGGYGFESLGQIAAATEHAVRDLADAGDSSVAALRAAASSLLAACERVQLSRNHAAA
ncbi:MAG: Hpt domain-containing protein [Phycisphaerales bacterium JB060]